MNFTMRKTLMQSMSRRGVSARTPKDPIRRIGTKVKEIKVETMGITIEKVIMFEMETTTATTTTSTWVTILGETI